MFRRTLSSLFSFQALLVFPAYDDRASRGGRQPLGERKTPVEHEQAIVGPQMTPVSTRVNRSPKALTGPLGTVLGS